MYPGGGRMDFWSLDARNSSRGRKYHRVVIDEAGHAPNLQRCWERTIRPTLTDYAGDAWFLGTPDGTGYFHRLYERGQSESGPWFSMRLPTTANPTIEASEVEEARRDLPPEAFAEEYLGIPSSNGGNPFGMGAISLCVGELSRKPTAAYGVDLAKSVDYTAVIGVDADGAVTDIQRWRGDWAHTRSRVLAMVGGVPALVDSTGAGDPNVEIMREHAANVEGFVFSASSKQHLMRHLMAAIHTGSVRFPDGWLRAELESFEFVRRPGGGVTYSAPHGLHDDGVCALALALWHLRAPRERLGVIL
jgi:hypothetical protein